MEVFEPEPTQQVLRTAISNKKREMIDLGMKYGLTDKRTVQCSQQLDYLLNLQRSMREFFELTG
ncbi:Spo0E like sporulation regulatory protein [Lentibacillus halodurans]|uniref:Spo0E like sporulation regulatory protein n=1 Tax=Lentibacillus halodurans TaxID=237679 RepID=A0A1I0ZVQ7_9BACI|nr:aspartyl-phosphate phosphatase Spo0E family protein [Lentibacillus halodurans]SFB28253.1 Spo0E like sporulation regulatory protein [Lentibacillus halodurans]